MADQPHPRRDEADEILVEDLETFRVIDNPLRQRIMHVARRAGVRCGRSWSPPRVCSSRLNHSDALNIADPVTPAIEHVFD